LFHCHGHISAGNASMTGKQDSSVFKNAILNTLEMQP